MCDKAVNTYPSTIKFVPEFFMTQEMCDKAVNRCFFVFVSISETPKICDKAVDDSLVALKLIHDWFLQAK